MPSPPRDFSVEETRWVDSILDKLSIQEMAAQLVIPAIYTDSTALSQLIYYTDSLKVGGIMLLKGDTVSARKITDYIGRSTASIPVFIGIDAEWGIGMRLDGAPSVSRNRFLPSGTDEQIMYDYGRETARQSRILGINMIFGPVIDVDRTDTYGVMSSRTFGSDPEKVSSMGLAYARGIHDGGVIPVAKHFPGHGSATVDSHKQLPVVQTPENELMSRDLFPFKEFIDMEFPAIMVGHIYAPALDSVRRSAAVSPSVITGLLRRRMGFSGLIVTDAMNMHGLGNERFPARDAMLAGADMILAPPDTEAAVNEIADICRHSDEARNILKAHCRRILSLKYRIGILKDKRESDKESCLFTEETYRLLKLLRKRE